MERHMLSELDRNKFWNGYGSWRDHFNGDYVPCVWNADPDFQCWVFPHMDPEIQIKEDPDNFVINFCKE